MTTLKLDKIYKKYPNATTQQHLKDPVQSRQPMPVNQRPVQSSSRPEQPVTEIGK